MTWLSFLPWLWWMWSGSNGVDLQLNDLWKPFGACVQLCVLLWPFKCFEIEVIYCEQRADQLLIRKLCSRGGSRAQWQGQLRSSAQSGHGWRQGPSHISLHLCASPLAPVQPSPAGFTFGWNQQEPSAENQGQVISRADWLFHPHPAGSLGKLMSHLSA